MKDRIVLILGIIVCLSVAFSLAVSNASGWEGQCGTHNYPVPCETDTTTPTTTTPEQPPVPTVPETVPTPTTTLPADVPAIIVPPVTRPVPATDCATLTRNGAGRKWLIKYNCVKGAKKFLCEDLRASGAGIRWLIKYKCATKLPGPFNPAVTGER